MDILVEGNGKISLKPNKVTFNYEFSKKTDSYEDALKLGIKCVESYLEILKGLDFKNDDLKTQSFRIYEDKVYNEITRKYEFDGYMFKQSARLSFDYDTEKFSKIMEVSSTQEDAPSYKIEFGVKDNKELEEQVLSDAYKDAEFQARAIAKATGKTNSLECIKISFEPFNIPHISQTRFDSFDRMQKCSANLSESIQTVFVPEDVTLKKTIYCHFIAN